MKKAILIMMLLTLTACAYVDPSITDQTTIYYDSPVRKSTLQVSVHPKGKQYRPLTAYFHPFVIQQPNSDYSNLSDAFAQIFHNAWTEERLFPTQEYEPGVPYQGIRHAIDTARRSGADLLILGFVPYFFAGHTIDDTAITIQINIYAAGTGDLLWTMMQSGRIEDKFPEDYIAFRQEYRLSDAPFNKIIRALAKDMAIPLKSWLPDPDARYQFASTTAQMETGLTTPPTSSTAATAMADGTGAPAGSAAQVKGMEQDLPTDSAKADGAATSSGDRPQVNGVNLDIQFDFDKATIKPESYPLLDSLGEALNMDDLKGRSIIIAGHTDQSGTPQYNQTLSKNRANSVKSYLVEKWAIPSDLIEAVGYGDSRPLNEGKTKEDRQKNRRVEVRLAE